MPLCEEHGLVQGPEGGCVLCRRSSVPPEKQGSRPLLPPVVVGALLAALCAGAAWHWSSPSARPTTTAGDLPSEDPLAAEAAPRDQPQPDPSQAVAADPVVLEESEAPRSPLPRHAQELPEASPSSRAAAAQPAPPEEPPDPRILLERLDIRMYATEWCPHCDRARQTLRRSGVVFREFDIDKDASAALRNKSLNPRGSVPTFDVDGEVMVGFSPSGLAALLERAVLRSSGHRIQISFHEG